MSKMKRLIKNVLQAVLTRSIILFSVKRKNNAVVLTFDDGPDPVFTLPILDVLRRKNAKAVFFLIGQTMEANPGLVKQIIDEGHSVGMHSYSHNRKNTYSNREQMNEVYRSMQIFKKFNIKTDIYRPVYGQISFLEFAICVMNGICTVLWTLSSGDFEKTGSQNIINRVIDNVNPGDIILFHDDNQYVVDALGVIIDTLRDKGLMFTGLDG